MKKTLLVIGMTLAFNAYADALPKECTLSDASGMCSNDKAQIYLDKDLKKSAKDYEACEHNLNPTKSYVVAGKNVYEGSIYYTARGNTQKGKFFINASEWKCK